MADVRQPHEGFLLPDDAARVVRVGEDEQFTAVVDDGFELVEIHLVGTVHLLQRVENHLAAHGARHDAERMIDRRLDNHLVARMREALDREADTLHDAGDVAEPLLLDFPVVFIIDPFDDGPVIRLACEGVAEDRMLATLLQRVDDEVRRSEVHVGNPEGGEVGVSERLLQAVVLHAVGAAPVDDLVKVILLHDKLFSYELRVPSYEFAIRNP